MIELTLAFLAIAAILLVGAYLAKNRLKNIFRAVASLWIVAPAVLIGFLAVFKTEMQQGYLLPELGRALMLVSPPDDYSEPLGKVRLNGGEREYGFGLRHKYVGSHIIAIEYRRTKVLEEMEVELELELHVSHNDTLLISGNSAGTGRSWQSNRTSQYFFEYEVPSDLPLREEVDATVKVSGDIVKFIELYGDAHIIARKGSDL